MLPFARARCRTFCDVLIIILFRPEPHILLFKRPLGTDPVSGKVDPTLEAEAKSAYQQELAGKMDPGANVAPMAM